MPDPGRPRLGSVSSLSPAPHPSTDVTVFPSTTMGSVAPIAQSEATTTTADADTVGERDSNELLSSVDHISAVAEDTSHSGGGEPNAVAELTGEDRDEDQDSCYWDASTMAPFNPASAVSALRLSWHTPHDTYGNQGRYCPAESLQTASLSLMGSPPCQQTGSRLVVAVCRSERRFESSHHHAGSQFTEFLG
jgi:hypothetical protein